jgi:hypothetical protein
MKEMTLSYNKFLNGFLPAFNNLVNLPSNKQSGKLKYAIKRSLDNIQEEFNEYNKKRIQIFEDRAKVDENGSPMISEDGSYTFESAKKRKEAFDALDELNNTKITLSIFPINKEVLDDIGGISIGQELNLLDFIIDEENIDE